MWSASRRLDALSRRGLMVDGAEVTAECFELTGLYGWNAWCDRRPRSSKTRKARA